MKKEHFCLENKRRQYVGKSHYFTQLKHVSVILINLNYLVKLLVFRVFVQVFVWVCVHLFVALAKYLINQCMELIETPMPLFHGQICSDHSGFERFSTSTLYLF